MEEHSFNAMRPVGHDEVRAIVLALRQEPAIKTNKLKIRLLASTVGNRHCIRMFVEDLHQYDIDFQIGGPLWKDKGKLEQELLIEKLVGILQNYFLGSFDLYE